MTELVLQSELTYPHCQHKEALTMPTDACQRYCWYKEILEPKKGDCYG